MKLWSLAVLTFPTLLWAQTAPLAVVRLTKTESVNRQDFDKRLVQAQALTGQNFGDKEKSLLLDQMIDITLILQQAEKESVVANEREVTDSSLALLSRQYGRRVTEAELRQQLNQSGSSFEEFIAEARRQFVLQKYLTGKFGDQVKAVPKPATKDIESYYDTYPQQFVVGDRVRFSQIFIKTLGLDEQQRTQAKLRADDLLKRVQQGEDLGELAAAYSEETVSRDNKGSLPFVVKNDDTMLKRFGREFFDKLFNMKVGELAMLESSVGYHIIRVAEFRDKQLLGLDDVVDPVRNLTVRQVISERVLQQRQQEKLLALQKKEVEGLRQKASIRIVEENLPFSYEQTS